MSTTEEQAPRAPRKLLAGVAVAMLVIAAAGYSWTGSPKLVLNPPQAAAPLPGEEQIAAMVEGLAQRLKENPEDPEGWVMLGRSYLVLGRVPDALVAYQEAIKRSPNDPRVMADYASALAISNNQRMTDEAVSLVQRALSIDPDNLKALSLAGSAAFDRGDYAAAVKSWERIVAVAPPGSDFIPEVQAGIDEARKRGGVAQPAGAAAPVAAAASAAVRGRVTLAAALAAQAAPEDTVFVFARAAEGPRMPLAIVKRQVKDLPFDFVLDDSTAMSPQMRLSSFQSVVVGARISKSGNATPQPGDLTGVSSPVSPGAQGLQLEISQVVPKP